MNKVINLIAKSNNSIFWLAFTVSFLSLVPPGILNITSIHISSDYGISFAVAFSLGVVFIELLYVGITLFFLKKIENNINLLKKVQWFSILILIGFSFYYGYLSFSMMSNMSINYGHTSFFICGVILSSLNFLAIAFWLFWSLFFIKTNVLSLDKNSLIKYFLGIGLGTISILLVFAIFGLLAMNFLETKSLEINIFTSLTFLGIALIQVYKYSRTNNLLLNKENIQKQ